jgi:hypothetical protein
MKSKLSFSLRRKDVLKFCIILLLYCIKNKLITPAQIFSYSTYLYNTFPLIREEIFKNIFRIL